MKKRVLVCGASGFLGFNVFQHLSKRQDLELAGTYLSNRYGRIDPKDPRFIQADLTTNIAKEVTANQDVIIQMAANSSGAKDVIERPYIHVTPNTIMNTLLIQSAFDNNVGQFIFPSCTVMYPSQLEPSSELDVDFNNIPKVYLGGAWMKLYTEKLCQFFSTLKRTKFTTVRHSNIYGPNDRFDPERSHVFGSTIRKVSEAESEVVVWGQGKEVRDFLYIDDFVRFIELIIDNQDYEFDLFNLGSENPISITKLVEKVIKLSGKNLKIIYDPKGPSIGTMISIDSSKARQKFSWQPLVKIDEGVKKTLEWYMDNRNRR